MQPKTITTGGALLLSCALAFGIATSSTLAQDAPIKLAPFSNTEEKISGDLYEISKIEVAAPAEKVQQVLENYSDAPRIFENVKKCKVVADKGEVKDVAYTVSTMGNIWTFDYVLELKESKNYIEWHRVKGAFKRNQGYWRLEPQNNGRTTMITYAKFIDGGPLMPQGLVRKEIKATMSTVMANLKKAVESQAVAMNS